jgi:hypothetical protein
MQGTRNGPEWDLNPDLMFAPSLAADASFASLMGKTLASSRFEMKLPGSIPGGSVPYARHKEWPHLDLNQGPTGYEPAALTN